MKIHEPTGRPMADGLPVPFVTLWDSEQAIDPMCFVGESMDKLRLAYADDPHGYKRDHHGMLWIRDRNTPGVGRPLWRQVHALRARQSAIGRRCQVCGGKFPKTGPLTFVFNRPGEDDIRNTTDPFITMFTPTCRRCAPWAAIMCPNLRRTGAQFAVANDVKPVGAMGDLYGGPDTGSHPMRVRYNDDDALMQKFLAKQPLLRIADYHTEPMPELDRGARA